MCWRCGVVTLILCLAGGAAAAQQPQAVVSGTGVEMLKVLPDEMRVTVSLQVQGATNEQALEAYRTRREAVRKLLADAGAKGDSVEAGEPKLSKAGGSRQEMMMRRMMAQGDEFGSEEKPAEPKKQISFTAKAAWALSAASVEDLFLEAARIADKVEALDLVGKADMSPEQLEELEEAGMDTDDYSSYGQRSSEPGKPNFFYARKVDPARIMELKKKAYLSAVKGAERTAAVADRQLGELVSLATGVNAGALSSDDYYERMYYASMMMSFGDQTGDGSEETVAVGSEPGELTVTVHVTAGFSLK